MTTSGWRTLIGIDQRRLHEARLQAHHAAQWLARTARAYIAPLPDDGHTSLRWDDDLNGFTTLPLENGVRLSLQITSLTLALHDGDRVKGDQSLSLTGHSETQIRHWLGKQFSDRGFDPRALDAPSPYEIPSHAISRGASYDANGATDALAELAAWFANAESQLDGVRKRIIGRKLAASPVCCWPHHFDLATLTILPKHNAETGYVGVGLSPGDEYYDEPYFYVSIYPKPDPAMLPTLPMFGHWHTHEFMAAVVPAHKILAAKDQKAETEEFLGCAVDTALKLLS